MNYTDAENLLTRMGQCWRVPFGQEWHEAFKDLDAGRAGTAFVRLRDTEERPPTIAKFKGAYQSIRGETKHEPRCEVCDGTGLRAPDDDAWGTESPPCEYCDMGRIQGERIAEASMVKRSDKTLSPGQCDNGLEWAKLLAEQARSASGRVKARRWVA